MRSRARSLATFVLGLGGRIARLVAALWARLRWAKRPVELLPEVPDSRRRLLTQLGAAAAAGVAALVGRLPRSWGNRLGRRKHQWGMVIDLDRCSGCGACTVACRQENNVPTLGPEPENAGARVEWMSLLWREPEDEGGLPELLPFPCQHCENAPCTKVCPVGATYVDPEGMTAQIWDRCIGCRYCMAACPYARRSFNWTAPEWPGESIQLLNPDVATRPRGVVEKCTFCVHRIQRVREEVALEGREMEDGDLKRLTACAAACPAGAIVFGDHLDHGSTMSRLAKSPRAFRLLDHLGTKPRVIYLKRDRRA